VEDFIDSVRKRPGMYLGSTDVLGLGHLFEFTLLTALPPGAAGSLRVRLDGRQVTVETDAAVDADETVRVLDAAASDGGKMLTPTWELVAVNALSERFAIDVMRGDEWWTWRGQRGRRVAGEPLRRATGPGTVITFTPDRDIFRDAEPLTAPWLQPRLQELAALRPGLAVALADEAGRQFALRWPDGLADWLRSERVRRVRSVETQWEDVRVRAAYGASYDELQVRGFANSVPTRQGGGHIGALRDAVRQVSPDLDRWRGLIAVDMPYDRLRFQGPTKELLAVEGLREGVRSALMAVLGGASPKGRDAGPPPPTGT
jgi:DNA gyrase/topoisomerase IV subunit B